LNKAEYDVTNYADQRIQPPRSASLYHFCLLSDISKIFQILPSLVGFEELAGGFSQPETEKNFE